ncbi:hypothetical protein [Insolitispirillum peregrinum]|uniref:hypothetical protein n=1 Tax=Insolitispirillum peregrinum TaxID=80876 RepID=UPI0036D2494E
MAYLRGEKAVDDFSAPDMAINSPSICLFHAHLDGKEWRPAPVLIVKVVVVLDRKTQEAIPR